MKPTKNQVFCNGCGRTKMLFETEKKAQNFMKFNNEELEAESGYCPKRSYHCLFCGGWHLTSIKENIGVSRKEQAFEEYQRGKNNALGMSNPKKAPAGYQEIKNKKINDLENQIKEMDGSEKNVFFAEKITVINKEINRLLELNSNNISDIDKLKDLRRDLEVLYVVRKQGSGQNQPKTTPTLDAARAKEIKEWMLWAKTKGY